MYSLNVSKCAELLGVSPDTVRRLADNGHLPSHRLPSGWRRFDAGEVIEFRDKLRHPIANEPVSRRAGRD